MDRTNSQVTERIINLTLEILSLLTGEDYVMVKKQSICIPEKDSEAQSGKTIEPEDLLILNIPEKDPEVSSKSSSIPAPEVSLRCEDIAVYLSMEEWEYLEAHREDYEYERTEDPNTSMGVPAYSEIQLDGILIDRFPENCTNKVTFAENVQKENISLPCSSPEQLRNLDEDPILEEKINISHLQRKSRRRKPRVSKQKSDGKNKRTYLTLQPCEFNEGGLIINKVDLRSHQGSRSVGRIEDCSFMSPGNCLQTSDQPMDQIQYEMNRETSGVELNTRSAVRKMSANFTDQKPWKSKSERDHFKPNLRSSVAKKDKQHLCSFCGKGFRAKSKLIRHVRGHTGEKPFECAVCGKCFSEKSGLFRHQKIHTRVKTFVCNECGEEFLERASIAEHLNIHPGEKPYMCMDCGKLFKYLPSLQNHQRLHKHGGLPSVLQ